MVAIFTGITGAIGLAMMGVSTATPIVKTAFVAVSF